MTTSLDVGEGVGEGEGTGDTVGVGDGEGVGEGLGVGVGLGDGDRTAKVAGADLTRLADAVIRAVPVLSAVAVPRSSTVATVALLDSHSKMTPGTGFP